MDDMTQVIGGPFSDDNFLQYSEMINFTDVGEEKYE